MAWVGVIYHGKYNDYVLINCSRHCVREELVQKLINLCYNLGSHTGSKPSPKSLFFNYYLAAPRPTSGHYRGDSLTDPMLITAFYIFDPKVTGSLVVKLGP